MMLEDLFYSYGKRLGSMGFGMASTYVDSMLYMGLRCPIRPEVDTVSPGNGGHWLFASYRMRARAEFYQLLHCTG